MMEDAAPIARSRLERWMHGVPMIRRYELLWLPKEKRESMKAHNKLIRFVLSLLTVVIALPGAITPAHAQGKKPNIVLILADNLGHGELGSYGGGITRGAPTPRLDKLAG